MLDSTRVGPNTREMAKTYSNAFYYQHEPWLSRALTFPWTISYTLGIKATSGHHHLGINICDLCNQNLEEDEYHSLLTCSSYKVIFKKYDDLLDEHDNFSVIHKSPPRRVRAHTCLHYFHIKHSYYRVVALIQMSHIQYMFI